MIMLPCSISPDAADLLHARVLAAMGDEVEARRRYWIAGVPTELDLSAARKAVARRLNTTPEFVVAMLARPISQTEEPNP